MRPHGPGLKQGRGQRLMLLHCRVAEEGGGRLTQRTIVCHAEKIAQILTTKIM